MARGKGLARNSQQARQDQEDAPACPLCIEPLDTHEQSWFPCPCGYQVCAFCHQRLHLENNNQCPGCRTTYGSHTAETFKPPASTSNGPSPAKEPAKADSGRTEVTTVSATAPKHKECVPANVALPNGKSSRRDQQQHVQPLPAGPSPSSHENWREGKREIAVPVAVKEKPQGGQKAAPAAKSIPAPAAVVLGRTTHWADPSPGPAATSKPEDGRKSESQSPESASTWPQLGKPIKGKPDAPAKRSKTPLTDARAPGWQEESPAASSSTLSERLGLESAGSQSTEEGEEVSHRDGGGGREGAAVEGSLGDRLMAAAAAGRLPLDPEGSKLREDALEAVSAGRMTLPEASAKLATYVADRLLYDARSAAEPAAALGDPTTGASGIWPVHEGGQQEGGEGADAGASRPAQPAEGSRSWLTEGIQVSAPPKSGHSKPTTLPGFAAGGLGAVGKAPQPQPVPMSQPAAGSQHGGANGLGISLGSNSGMDSLWGPLSLSKQSSTSSFWHPHLGDSDPIDRVPDSLQELWADLGQTGAAQASAAPRDAPKPSGLVRDNSFGSSYGRSAGNGSAPSSFLSSLHAGTYLPSSQAQYGTGAGVGGYLNGGNPSPGHGFSSQAPSAQYSLGLLKRGGTPPNGNLGSHPSPLQSKPSPLGHSVFPQGAFPSTLGKPPGQLQHPQPGASNPLGLGQGAGGYLQSSLGPSSMAYQPQLQNRFATPGQAQQQGLQNRDFQPRFGGALGGHQGLGSSAAAPPGLGGMANPRGGYAGSPGQGYGLGKSPGQLIQELWSQQQQLGNQQKQLQMERQGNLQRLAQQQGLLDSLSQFQLQQLLAQQQPTQQPAQRAYQEGQGLWQTRSASPGVNGNGGNGMLDPNLGRRLYQR